MKTDRIALRNLVNRLSANFLLSALLLILLVGQVSAQQSATDGSTPLGLSPGSPAGSYSLSDFDSVNLFNGSLNFRLPLLKIGGRGVAGYQFNFQLDQKWTVGKYQEPGLPTLYWAQPNWWSETVYRPETW